MADDRRSAVILDVAAEAAHRETRDLFRAAGHTVREASSAEEAWCILAQERVDLLVLEADLSREAAWDLRRRIRADPAFATLPTLHLGVASVAEEEIAAQGADAFLPDSPPPGLLRANVQALLRARQMTERLTHAREECEEAQRTLQALLEYIPQGILIADAPEGRLRGVSRYALAHSGMTPEQLQDLLAGRGATAWQALYADGVTPMPAEEMPLNRATRRGEVITSLEMAVRRANQLAFLLVDAGPIRDDAGGITGGVAAWRDITARRRLEEERELLLAESTKWRTFLDAVQHQMPSGVLIAEAPSGHLISLNDRALEILRLDALSAHVLEQGDEPIAFHLDGSPYSRDELPLLRALRTGEAVRGEELQSLRGDCSRVTVRASAAPVRDAAGNILAGVLVFDDITDELQNRQERERLFEERARQSRLLETLVETTPHWLAYLDRDLRVALANTAFASKSPLLREELIGKHFLEIFPDQTEVYAFYERARSAGEVVSGREFPTHLPGHPELGVHFITFSIAPVKDAAGEVEGVVLSAEDVTDQVHTRERLLAAERARAELAENLNREISHRVKNNLTMLAGLLRLQSREHADPRLTAILHDTASRLLTFASIHEQLQAAPEGAVDLLAALSRLVEATRTAVAPQGVEFAVEGEPIALPAQSATNLAVVANELITNAAKYGHGGRDAVCRVKVALHPRGSALHLSVWNSGNPVAPDFDVLRAARLGLRLVWKLVVEQYDGAFSLRPQQEGSLAEVHISLDHLA